MNSRHQSRRRAKTPLVPIATGNMSIVAHDAATPTTTADASQRRAMIADAAYFRSAQRGFSPGHEVEDWLEAEREICSTLDGTRQGSGQRV